MDHAEALGHLRAMMFAVQKARSTLFDSFGDDALGQKLLAEINPWLFGDGSILPTLAKVTSAAERGESIRGHDFLNLMFVAHKEEAIFLIAEPQLPEVDFEWAGQVWEANERGA